MDYVAFAFNSTTHKSTSFSPSFLHFGRELNSSVDILLSNPTTQYASSHAFVADVADRMSYAFSLVRETLQQTSSQAKRWYDKRVKEATFSVGDRVLIYNPHRYKNRYPKWQRFYSEECVISKRLNDVIYMVKALKVVGNE